MPGVAVYEAKQAVVPLPPLLTKEVLAQQKEDISASAALINSRRMPDVVAYGCTSGAMGVGSNVIADMVHEAVPNANGVFAEALVRLAARAVDSAAIAAGRAEVLRELPALLAQRRAIQTRRTASINALEAWVAPSPLPLAVLAQQRRLAELLK